QGLRVSAAVADALELPLANGAADGVIVAFGVRNFADLDAGLREMHRVTAPGRRLVILEFTTPPASLVRGAYEFYSHRVLPFIGRMVSGHRTAYRYFPKSVDNFPDAPALAERLRAAGFVDVGFSLLTFGIAAVHSGVRTA
ncbi:MAG: class I SAM-dependent methyltransferase, partial [Gemmatimonadaceae bacterium]